ncbi:MAG TPA: hypothetical protein EYN00_00245 [Planctomycetes bacterium]|nr:hypothetical protein [Planctomycetota bacterium]
MVTTSFNFSFGRFFFGCAILAAAVVFGLSGTVESAAGGSLFSTSALILFLGCVIAPCVIACNSNCWNAGFSVFGGNCNNNSAAGYFWSCFSNYAIYGGIIASVATVCTTLGSIATPSWGTVVASGLLPVFYGWTLSVIANSICRCCWGAHYASNSNAVTGSTAVNSSTADDCSTADNNTSNTNVTYSS